MTSIHPRGRLVALAAVSLVALAAAPSAFAGSRTALYDTLLLSRSSSGDVPNGPSTNGVISQDGRIAKGVAFQSDASNIVGGDTNGTTDVFLIERRSGYHDQGEAWAPGRTRMVSRAPRGRPANGPSYGPAISGDASSGPRGSEQTPPNCVAFVSQASNLVSGDTNRKADAFVFWMSTGKITRVSVSSDGRQANGNTYDVAVDGACERVAFTSDATNLAQTSNGGEERPNFSTVKTGTPRAGIKQVYVHVPRTERSSDAALKGLTFLASASNSGTPGNGHSSDPSWSLRTSQVLSFTSEATNLDRRDRSRTPDVYVSGQRREVQFFGVREVNRAKYSTIVPSVRVVSVNRRGRAANGPSFASGVSDQGCFVAFETQASELGGPVSTVLRADIRGFLISRKVLDGGDPKGCRDIDGPAPRGDSIRMSTVARGNGPANDPEVAGGGQYIAFASTANHFIDTRDGWFGVAAGDADLNGQQDAFLWTGVRKLIRVFSAAPRKRQLALPSGNPFPSQRVNYLLFETTDPTATRRIDGYDDAGAGTSEVDFRAPPILETPISNQIYLRYLGGKFV